MQEHYIITIYSISRLSVVLCYICYTMVIKEERMKDYGKIYRISKIGRRE